MDADTLVIKIPLKDDDYKRTFDPTVMEWRDSTTMNHFFLRMQQNYFNDLLRLRGFVFLNEVLTVLSFDPTPIGAVTGWFIDENTKSFIDFGVKWDEPNNDLTVIPLLFNVQGVIVDKI